MVIFTDGIDTNMDDAINSIIEASFHPISIIIVGVGNENFSEMKWLDSDDELLRGN